MIEFATLFGVEWFIIWARKKLNLKWIERAVEVLGSEKRLLVTVFFVTLFLYVLVVGPYEIHKEDQDKIEKLAVGSTPAPGLKLQINETDNQARSQVAELQTELSTANARIRELDPLNQPVASATATADIRVNTNKNLGGTYIYSCMIAFGEGSSAISIAQSNQFLARTEEAGNISLLRLNCSVPYDSPILGKQITDLLKSEYIQITIYSGVLPDNFHVIGGTVVWVINNGPTLKFEIPEQDAQKQSIFVRDLYDGFKPIRPITPPSQPTPTAATSPH